jgi:hypothetical protein
MQTSAKVGPDTDDYADELRDFSVLMTNIGVEPVNLVKSELYTHKKDTRSAVLDVIAVVSNPARYERRYELFKQFVVRMHATPNVRLTTIELQQRARPFITDATLKFRTKHELWHKENMINNAVQRLPEDWEYVAWIDADIVFQNENWAQEAIEQLQTYDIVQLFSHAIDLGPNLEVLQVHTGFMFLYANGIRMNNYRPGTPYKNGHSGYAWACRKSAYNAMGGLMEFPILGSADAHMAMAFIGDTARTINRKLHKNYKDLVLIFQERCERHIKRNVGYVCGTINHFFHGDKQNRKYKERYGILIENQFDPLRDIKKDNNNLWQLEDNKPALRDEIRKYFRQRNEDSKDINQDYTYIKAANNI